MSKSAYPELVNALSSFKDYGFTQLQAAAYIAILQLGEDTGSAIAKASGINRSKIYDTLNQLEEMGAVKVISKEGRTRYAAVSPDIIFKEVLQKFANHLDSNKAKLYSLQEKQVVVDPSRMTLTKLKLNNLDVNDFDYLITSNERSRSYLLDQLTKDNQPSVQVKILSLYDNVSKGLVLLMNEEVVYLFPTPTGEVVDAIKLEDPDISTFFLGLIESWWQKDIPDHTMEEINDGKLLALHIGKSLYMQYKMYDGREYIYERPVSYLLTESHMSFFYEGVEEPKIPLFAVDSITDNPDGSLTVIFKMASGDKLGEMRINTVEKNLFLKNLLLTLARLPR